MTGQKRKRRERKSSRWSTNFDSSDMEAFYLKRERIEMGHHRSHHEDKFFKQNVRFSKFSGGSNQP